MNERQQTGTPILALNGSIVGDPIGKLLCEAGVILASWQSSIGMRVLAHPNVSKKRLRPQTSCHRCPRRDAHPYRNIGIHGPWRSGRKANIFPARDMAGLHRDDHIVAARGSQNRRTRPSESPRTSLMLSNLVWCVFRSAAIADCPGRTAAALEAARPFPFALK